jgi:hypothetical protein
MMWSIYTLAKCVIAWLGGPEDDAKLAMQLIFDAASPIVVQASGERRPIFLPTDPNLGELPFHFDALVRDALTKLLERPWFRKVWIIQEIAAAKDAILVCSFRLRR